MKFSSSIKIQLRSIRVARLLTTLFLIAQGTIIQAQGFRSTAELDSANFRIGDPIVLHITVDHPFEYSIDWLKHTPSTKNFDILNESAVDTITQRSFTTEKKTITLTSFDTGRLRTPAFTIWYHDNTGSLKNDKINQISINVSAVPVDLTKPFLPVTPPLHVASIDYVRIAAIGAIVIALLLLSIFYLRWQKQKRKLKAATEQIDTSQINISDQLLQLERQKKLKQISLQEYYVQLTNLLRKHIQSRYSFPAAEHTSREIISFLRREISDKEILHRLSKDFQLADLVKFAKFSPSQEEDRRVMSTIKEFVTQTENATV